MAKTRFTFSKPLLTAHLGQVEVDDIHQVVVQAIKHMPSQIAIKWPEGYRPDFLLLQALEMLALQNIQIQLPEAHGSSELMEKCFENIFSKNSKQEIIPKH